MRDIALQKEWVPVRLRVVAFFRTRARAAWSARLPPVSSDQGVGRSMGSCSP
ncbi:MAG: hypothetical protein M3468_04385 [Acidobacteriota bacterium]|nr:hypothetical protein [Acidobacteriota bacterium]